MLIRVIIYEDVIINPPVVADFTFNTKYTPWAQIIEDLPSTPNTMNTKRYRMEFHTVNK